MNKHFAIIKTGHRKWRRADGKNLCSHMGIKWNVTFANAYIWLFLDCLDCGQKHIYVSSTLFGRLWQNSTSNLCCKVQMLRSFSYFLTFFPSFFFHCGLHIFSQTERTDAETPGTTSASIQKFWQHIPLSSKLRWALSETSDLNVERRGDEKNLLLSRQILSSQT